MDTGAWDQAGISIVRANDFIPVSLSHIATMGVCRQAKVALTTSLPVWTWREALWRQRFKNGFRGCFRTHLQALSGDAMQASSGLLQEP